MSKLIDKNTPKHATLMSVKISSTTLKRVLTFVDLQLKNNVQVFISTPNPEIVLAAQKDIKLLDSLNSAEVSVPDGVGLLWAAKVLNFPLELERIPGRILMEALFDMAYRKKNKVFLLGGSQETNIKAQKRLNIKYDGIMVDGTSDILVDKDGKSSDTSGVIKQINKFEADFLIVALGAPKQEKWIADNREKINAKVIMTVGGALDYFSGTKAYPPSFVSKAGLEWLWRLVTQPSRLPRIFNAVVLFPIVVLWRRINR